MIKAIFGTPETTLVLVTAASVKRNRDIVNNALAQGAEVVYGNSQPVNDVAAKMAPIVLSNINKNMDIYQTESFGPSVSLFTFEDEGEALKLVNDTDYGLTASIYTKDLNKTFSMAEKIDSGAVHINSMSVHDEFALPHGGVKSSGFVDSMDTKVWMSSSTTRQSRGRSDTVLRS